MSKTPEQFEPLEKGRAVLKFPHLGSTDDFKGQIVQMKKPDMDASVADENEFMNETHHKSKQLRGWTIAGKDNKLQTGDVAGQTTLTENGKKFLALRTKMGDYANSVFRNNNLHPTNLGWAVDKEQHFAHTVGGYAQSYMSDNRRGLAFDFNSGDKKSTYDHERGHLTIGAAAPTYENRHKLVEHLYNSLNDSDRYVIDYFANKYSDRYREAAKRRNDSDLSYVEGEVGRKRLIEEGIVDVMSNHEKHVWDYPDGFKINQYLKTMPHLDPKDKHGIDFFDFGLKRRPSEFLGREVANGLLQRATKKVARKLVYIAANTHRNETGDYVLKHDPNNFKKRINQITRNAFLGNGNIQEAVDEKFERNEKGELVPRWFSHGHHDNILNDLRAQLSNNKPSRSSKFKRYPHPQAFTDEDPYTLDSVGSKMGATPVNKEYHPLMEDRLKKKLKSVLVMSTNPLIHKETLTALNELNEGRLSAGKRPIFGYHQAYDFMGEKDPHAEWEEQQSKLASIKPKNKHEEAALSVLLESQQFLLEGSGNSENDEYLKHGQMQYVNQVRDHFGLKAIRNTEDLKHPDERDALKANTNEFWSKDYPSGYLFPAVSQKLEDIKRHKDAQNYYKGEIAKLESEYNRLEEEGAPDKDINMAGRALRSAQKRMSAAAEKEEAFKEELGINYFGQYDKLEDHLYLPHKHLDAKVGHPIEDDLGKEEAQDFGVTSNPAVGTAAAPTSNPNKATSLATGLKHTHLPAGTTLQGQAADAAGHKMTAGRIKLPDGSWVGARSGIAMDQETGLPTSAKKGAPSGGT